ncbi:hypothetical protein, partial [Halovulum sp. GXIMD14793]
RKPQSSDRSAKSQNPQVYQVEINSCHKRQCRASGFVHEPLGEVLNFRCARSPRKNFCASKDFSAVTRQ